MKLTEYLKLKKPDQTDFYNVEDFNENMEIMDLAIHEHGAEKNNPHEVTKDQVGLSNVPNVATNDQTPTYGIASVRENLSSGEKLSTAFGKIRRWFADLKPVAFSGSYHDLNNKPVIPTKLPADGGNADMVDGKHFQDIKEDACIAEYTEEDPNTATFPEHVVCRHANCPRLAYWWLDTVYFGRVAANTYRMQIAREYYGKEMFYRYWNPPHTGTENGWSEWHNMRNADTVDGKHAVDFYSRVAVYNNQEDPNITTHAIVLTAHKNCPEGEGIFYYIQTIFYTDISGGFNKTQIAYSYSSNLAKICIRSYIGGTWTMWRNISDNGNSETSRRLNSTVPGTAFSNPQLKGDLKGFNYTYEETLSGTAEHEKSPQPNAQLRSWNIINLAYATNRAAQIAIQTFRPEQKMYFRGRHIDNDDFSTWQEWKEVFTTDKIANNLETTVAGYALDAKQGYFLNARLGVLENARKNMQNYASGVYSVFYPEKDYTINGIGTTQSYLGFLNLYNSKNPNTDLYSVTKTTATSDNCRGSAFSPTNYIKFNQSGLYQIDVQLTRKGTVGFKTTVNIREGGNNTGIAVFGCSDDSKYTHMNIIQYIDAGTDLFVCLELNASTGSLSLNYAADTVGGIASGLFIKRIM